LVAGVESPRLGRRFRQYRGDGQPSAVAAQVRAQPGAFLLLALVAPLLSPLGPELVAESRELGAELGVVAAAHEPREERLQVEIDGALDLSLDIAVGVAGLAVATPQRQQRVVERAPALGSPANVKIEAKK